MFIDEYKKQNAIVTDAFEVEYPEAFVHPLYEYRALVERAAVVDLTHWGVLRLTGADRVRLLNSMITNDVSELETGQGARAALTTIRGKLVADLIVLARAEEMLVLVAQGSTDSVRDAIDKHIIADDVTIQDLTGEIGALSVEGPKARDMVWRLFPEDPIPLERFAFTDTAYQEHAVMILNNNVCGDKGYQLVGSRSSLEVMGLYVMQAGLAIDMARAGLAAWNMRRIENGLPWFGPDVTEDNFPKESRLDDLVNYNKGCFLGQETLARMHFRGHPNWRLVGLAPDGETPPSLEPPEFMHEGVTLPTLPEDAEDVATHVDALRLSSTVTPGTELFDTAGDNPDKAVGRITSGAFSPSLGKPLFLGYVRHKLAETGARFRMPLGDTSVELVITDLPIETQKGADE